MSISKSDSDTDRAPVSATAGDRGVEVGEPKFTPGPYDADEGDGQYFCVFDPAGNPLAVLAEVKGPVHIELLPQDDGQSEDYRRYPEHKANARLFAASWDYDEAARCFVRWIAEYGNDLPASTLAAMENAFGANLRAALAKTEGRRP
jgi:hypothetical protein